MPEPFSFVLFLCFSRLVIKARTPLLLNTKCIDMNICPARHASTFCVPTSIPPGHLCAFTCVSLVPKLTHLPTIIFDASSAAASPPPPKHQVQRQCPLVPCSLEAAQESRRHLFRPFLVRSIPPPPQHYPRHRGLFEASSLSLKL
jgi:hypothetical protein